MHFIQRDYRRTREDDWKLNVQPKLNERNESVEVKIDGHVVGWEIKSRFE